MSAIFLFIILIPIFCIYRLHLWVKHRAKKIRDLENYVKFCVERDKIMKEGMKNKWSESDYDLAPETYAYFASLMNEGEYHANL